VHVRKDDGECIGCVEVGLFEIVKALVLDEEAAATPGKRALSGGCGRLAPGEHTTAEDGGH
jgi:hypothetical protein